MGGFTEVIDILVMPDGKCLIVARGDISHDQALELRDAFERWRESNKGALVVNGTVRLIESVDLEETA
jgi:anti-anti-sigma regulatory factor